MRKPTLELAAHSVGETHLVEERGQRLFVSSEPRDQGRWAARPVQAQQVRIGREELFETCHGGHGPDSAPRGNQVQREVLSGHLIAVWGSPVTVERRMPDLRSSSLGRANAR